MGGDFRVVLGWGGEGTEVEKSSKAEKVFNGKREGGRDRWRCDWLLVGAYTAGSSATSLSKARP